MKGFEWVAVILAAGISLALLVMTSAALWVAVAPWDPNLTPRLGENATQVLTGWGGGMIGVLGAYVGYAFGSKKTPTAQEEPPHVDGTD